MPPAAPFEHWLKPDAAGLYCEPGGFHIDPTRRVERAIITHGHSDHARPGHGAVLATPETIAIMKARLGPECAGSFQALRYGERARASAASTCALAPGRPHPRQRAGGDRASRASAPSSPATTSAAPDPTCRAVRAGALRRVRHRGDLRPAGVPPRARRARDRPAARLARSVPRAHASRRRLWPRQGPAADRAAARGRLRPADLSARRAASRCASSTARSASSSASCALGRRCARPSCRARSCCARRRRSRTAGRGG